jgi:sec-independent protein translocase protein TatB
MKAEASKFKSQIEETKASLTIDTKVDLGLKDIMNDDLNIASSIDNKINKMEEAKQEKVLFKKDEKKEVNA